PQQFILFFFFNDTATTEIYTLSLHDALPIWLCHADATARSLCDAARPVPHRSEEHTSELQSHSDLVCRLLLEKKKKEITVRVWWSRSLREMAGWWEVWWQ